MPSLLWKRLLAKIGINSSIKPSAFETFNGTVIFWFDKPSEVKEVLVRLKESGIAYTVEWDREEGFMGISLKRDALR